ncbi:MAG: FAD-dependent oxidoreductase [Clostridia bacterium]|nr:FAD-dependent oxidoreductase [Clostridia bacterium]
MVEFKREVPVSGKYDVVVCGGGPAGIGASLAAAREGCKTLIIERFGFFGGMATAGYVDPMSEFAYNGSLVTGGIPWEFANELVKAGGGIVEEPRCNVSFNPEIYKLVAQRMLLGAGVKLMMNTFLIGAECDDKKIKRIFVTNKSGISAIEAETFVDATGDGDLANFAGVPMLPLSERMQPGSFCFILSGVDTTTERMHIIHQKNHRFNHQAVFIRDTLFKLREEGEYVPQFGGPWLATTLEDGCITVNMTRSAVDATNAEEYCEAECKMREDIFRLVELICKHVPEFKNAKIASTAPMAGVRETRRIKGVHVLTGEEYVNTVKFPDSIARACHPVDIHLPGDEGQKLTFPKDAGYIPYRSLITNEYKNLLVAGRAASADSEAFAAIRVQAPCMEMGQAAGIAAGLAKRQGVCVTDINTDELVEIVRKYGSFV